MPFGSSALAAGCAVATAPIPGRRPERGGAAGRRLTLPHCVPLFPPSDKYYKAAKIADALSKDVHYTVDEKQRSVLLTEDG